MLFGLGTKAWSAIAASVVMVSAVIAGVAVAGDEDFDPVHAPEWKPGYTFSYDVSGHMKALVDGLQDEGVPAVPVEIPIDPFLVKKEVLNTADYQSPSRQPLYVSAANFPMGAIQSGAVLDGIGNGTTFLLAERQNDLAPLAVVPDFSCTRNACASGGVKVLADNPLTYLSFPLTDGKKWTQTADLPLPLPDGEMMEFLDGISRVYVAGEVTGMESVDLGELGSTDAVRVDIAYYPVGLQETLSRVAQQLEDAGVQIDRFNIELSAHEIVHYSPEYEAIVKQQYLVHMLFDVAASGDVYGHSFDRHIYAELEGTVSSVLAGSNRAVTEELDAGQIMAKLGNVDLINDARGVGASKVNVPYSILLESSAKAVNVASKEAVDFGVFTGGNVPAGHHLQYIVRGMDGVEVASGPAAGGFTFAPSEPGVYSVTVRSINEAGKVVVTSATRYVEGDFHAIVPAACSISLTGTNCAPHNFAVNAGAHSAVFEVYQYSGTPGLSQQLRVYGADGMVSSYDRVDLDKAEIAKLGYGGWRMTWTTTGSFLVQADYLIDVDYQAPQFEEIVVSEPAPSGGEGGGLLDVLGRMVQTVDAGLAGLPQGTSLDVHGILG